MNGQQFSEPLPAWLEQAWLERYLERGLNDDECAWFEAYALEKPQLLGQIEADSDLRDAAALAHWPAAVAAPSVSTSRPRPVRRRRPGAWWALAAGVVAGIALTALVAPWQSGGGLDTGGVLQPPRLIYDAWRGAGYQVREEAGDPDSPVVLVEVAVPAGLQPRSVHAELDGAEPRELVSAHLSTDGFLGYLLPRDWLGRARLHIRFDPNQTTAPDLVIDLDRPAG